MYTSGVRVAVLLVQLLAMFAVSQARFNCTVYHDPSEGLESLMFQPQDGNYFVYPNVMCIDTGLEISLVTSYTDTQLEGSRILGLFYECTNASGNNVTGEVPDSFKFDINDYVYRVELPSSFVEPGASCLVYGCYEKNERDTINIYYLIQNRSCDYTEDASLSEPSPLPPSTVNPVPYLQCIVPSEFGSYEFRPQDGDYFVYPNMMCTDTGLEISLIVTNYTDTQLSNTRILGLFYECTDASGNIKTGEVPNSRHFEIDDYVFSVRLTSSFIEPGASCLVYGCYEENSLDTSFFYFPIQNCSCQFGVPVSTRCDPPVPSSPPSSSTPSSISIPVSSNGGHSGLGGSTHENNFSNGAGTLNTPIKFFFIVGPLLAIACLVAIF